MIRRFLRSRLFFFYVCITIIGFFIGYDYTIITSRESRPEVMNTVIQSGTDSQPQNGDGLEDVREQ